MEIKKLKKVILIADTFFPERNSAALMLYSFINCISKKGIKCVVISPSSIELDSKIKTYKNYIHIKIYSPHLKSKNLIKRTYGEYNISKNFSKNILNYDYLINDIDLIISYSPTIFFGPYINFLKKKIRNVPHYLILRDIFPKWIIDLQIISKFNPMYFIFKYFENYLYKNSNKIGVQSKKNINYFSRKENIKNKIEYLPNWIDKKYLISKTSNLFNHLKFKTKFIYIGKLGLAQNYKNFLQFINVLTSLPNVCFIYIGEDFLNISSDNKKIFSFKSVSQQELNFLIKKCDFGLVNLDKRHTTHNIPGKSLHYLANGLPIIASLNNGNDFIDIINEKKIGYATNQELFEDNNIIYKIKEMISNMNFYKKNAMKYIDNFHNIKNVVKQITNIV